MTNTLSDLLERAAGRTVPVVCGITDDQLAGPTPCAEYDVRALVDHLFQVVVNFQRLAAKEDSDFGDGARFAGHGDWRTEFAAQTRALAEAWAVPGADEGETGAMSMPAALVGRMALGDLVVHAWDLARATGQEYAPDPGTVTEVRAAFGELAPTARTMGVFGTERELPAGDTPPSDFDRLLALTGRDPRWTRPAPERPAAGG
ncbi:TIGR03086 family metal-binding protein [Streptomyces genisteinicus]|uniref:TIGR03086 family protein n=1 Tax=Streptomyces genisteinicus TaxID=2768068 RepID=A0A7H0HVR4_9ACTN|nr:TIGR03086 family metal-binding protein [Streptomyces genisteinicus]QNP64630.1 TIGR03086 family protein [Streptomyces genisteinicus]